MSLRPGALEPSKWLAAVQQQLAQAAEVPGTSDREAAATWGALWHLLASPPRPELPTLEAFITRLVGAETLPMVHREASALQTR